ncbi:MAG TPA: cyanophycin synthetase, partial [Dehalococcoidia bacterium]
PVVDAAGEYAWRRTEHDLDGQTFRLEGAGSVLELRLPLLGAHQLENAATAVACVRALDASISADAVARGLASVSWPGRLEVLRRRPLVVADGAHSADSARRLRRGLTDYFSGQRAFLIVGMSAGKDVGALARELAPIAKRVFAVQSEHPRAMPAGQIADAFLRAGVEAVPAAGVAEALDRALAEAQNEEVICLAGSLFAVAEGRAHLQGTKATA